ncbi:16S rRNA (uracil(1498)-N(3))-methyltransferase [[Mycoplasma] collis]|uniref:16S rRNA (uracil(1498)-N(3))-methyltransferase n=1 Tax=[Mycoplasma] collis TaxID=2127 RepID=UPI00051B74AD|nr:16S rRNA (uracil(1498)-N(3))-methyltransferase [[Mycoplasma] collis]
MFRFFVAKKEDNYFILDNETLKHIKVARVNNKEFICVYEKYFYLCVLEDQKALIIKKLDDNHEFENKVIIAAAIISIKRFEWLIQKATELGASELWPIYSENMKQKLGNNIEHKVERWNLIAKNAAEQSFRNKAMIVKMPIHFKDVVNVKIKNKYIAHEKAENSLTNYFFEQDSIFLVGPEGGFSENEVNLAKKNNFKVISLGKRILRAETASIFILSRIKQ